MIKILKLVLIFSLCFVSTIFGQKINQKNGSGKRTGIWKKYYKGGRIRYEGKFQNGKEIGLFKFYDNSTTATPTVIKEFSSSSNVAKVKFFTKKNKLKAEGSMNGKVRIGKWVYYFKNGKPLSIENYSNGKLSGVAKNFYPNGKLTTEIYYTNGVKNGKSDTYADNGKIIEKVMYKNGKYHGPAEFYNLKGDLIEKGTFNEGLKTQDWTYYSADGSESTKRKRKTMKVK